MVLLYLSVMAILPPLLRPDIELPNMHSDLKNRNETGGGGGKRQQHLASHQIGQYGNINRRRQTYSYQTNVVETEIKLPAILKYI